MTSYPSMAQVESPTLPAPTGIGLARLKAYLGAFVVLPLRLPQRTAYRKLLKSVFRPVRNRITGHVHYTRSHPTTEVRSFPA